MGIQNILGCQIICDTWPAIQTVSTRSSEQLLLLGRVAPAARQLAHAAEDLVLGENALGLFVRHGRFPRRVQAIGLHADCLVSRSAASHPDVELPVHQVVLALLDELVECPAENPVNVSLYERLVGSPWFQFSLAGLEHPHVADVDGARREAQRTVRASPPDGGFFAHSAGELGEHEGRVAPVRLDALHRQLAVPPHLSSPSPHRRAASTRSRGTTPNCSATSDTAAGRSRASSTFVPSRARSDAGASHRTSAARGPGTASP